VMRIKLIKRITIKFISTVHQKCRKRL
jgi:hypothetical protein